MTHHVADEILALLAEGDLEDPVAAEVAEHLDVCLRCQARVEALDPLAPLYARVPDIEPPPDLVAAVLAEVERPERFPWLELSLGAVMLAVAAVLMVLFGHPIAAITRAGVVLDVFASLGSKLPLAGPAAAAVVCACVLTLTAVSMTTARLAGPVAERRIQ